MLCPCCGRSFCEYVRRLRDEEVAGPELWALIGLPLAAALLLLALALTSGCTSEDRSTGARTTANAVQVTADAGTAVLLLCEITQDALAAKPRDQIDTPTAEKIIAACEAANKTRKALRLTHDALLLAVLQAEALDDQRLSSVAAWAEVLRLTVLAKQQAQEAGAAILAARKAVGR